MQNIKQYIANLPHQPGVYQMLNSDGTVIYVGKAKNLKKRITSYFSKSSKDLKTLSLLQQICDIEITVTQSENAAVLLECNLIKKFRPRYNVLLRDDKSYPYILLTHLHPFPRIDLYRGARKKNALYFGPYPSSYAVRETISLLQKIFRIRTCSDSFFSARTRPCLLYQIGRCTAPCVGWITEVDYRHNVELCILFLQGKSREVMKILQERMEKAAGILDYEIAAQYRDKIARLQQIQERQYINVKEGDADIIGIAQSAGVVCIQLLSIRHGQIMGSRSYFPAVPLYSSTKEIIPAFITQHYLGNASHVEIIPRLIVIAQEFAEQLLIENVLKEYAKHKVEIVQPNRGEKKEWLRMAMESAKQTLAAQLFNKANMQERICALQKVLGLANMPKRIECFDISHSMGEATVASCVVFDQSGPVKNDYRRFNIRDITPGDDVAAMRQVLERRFKRLKKGEGVQPDIVLIDGGKTQLAVAGEVLKKIGIEHVQLIGVAKGHLRKPGLETLHFLHRSPLHLPADAQALHFIQQIRDEAHRFAITGHRHRRDKTRKQSTLELIPGIGAKRRRELLRYFGGIQGLAHASLDELVKVPGINRSLAERIFATFHDATV